MYCGKNRTFWSMRSKGQIKMKKLIYKLLINLILYWGHLIIKLKIKKNKHVIPRRLERRTYSYQKYTLPIKLRNLYIYYIYFKIYFIYTIKISFRYRAKNSNDWKQKLIEKIFLVFQVSFFGTYKAHTVIFPL